MTSQKNSFVTIAEQIQLFNTNVVEILTRMNQVVAGQDSVVNVTQLDEEGNETNFSLPTVGSLQKQINVLNNNVQRLAGLNDSTVHIIDGNATKKILQVDLDREPNRIDTLNTVTTFNSTNNWFFESLMNPIISVQFDLSEKVDDNVDGVLSRRYIVEFEKDDTNNYTDKGLQAKNDFINRFVNKSDINLYDFENWHKQDQNTGVYNNKTLVYDEQYFNFDYQEVQEHGTFSVLMKELDTINNKEWIHINPYTYTTVTGEQKILKAGDEIVLSQNKSVTRWSILETSTASSNFRIRVERIEGYEPIPVGANMLRFYGSTSVKKTVNISVGFDEYLVIFMKPTNSKNKIKGGVWSDGTGLYTNDLILSTNSNVSMAQYYLDTVYDYGELLKDMIQKTIPSQFGIKPNAPVLTDDNFKVVQINKHLTDTSDSKELRDLNAQKNETKTKLDQVNTAIAEKNKELSVKNYPSVAQKNKAQTELTNLIQQQESLSKLLYSTTTQIKSKTTTINKVEPKFRVRGFWAMPTAQQQAGYRDQEVVQFNVQYRYSSKNGSENQTEGYTIAGTNTVETGYFSNWVSMKSDLRKRTYNEATQTWSWTIEDVSDADTPNINQLDIPIQEGEKVEIRVSSISEVGYPDSIIESDWSNSLTIEFPDDLNSILDSNQFILKEAEQDSLTLQFEQSLTSKGVTKHVADSFSYNEQYVAHKDDVIQTNYKDDAGNSFTLREYLDYLTSKIKSLEEAVYSAKGILKVSIYNGVEEVNIDNNTTINLDFVCQNYGKTLDNINYDNNLYINNDFYLKMENLSNSQLSFLVKESYVSGTTIRKDLDNLPCLVDFENDFVVQENNQFIYFSDNIGGNLLYSGNTSNTPGIGSYIYSQIISTTTQPGLARNYVNKSKTGTTEVYSALGELNSGTNDWNSGSTMATLICPLVSTIDDLIVNNNVGTNYKSLNPNDFIYIPIRIYWKFQTGTDASVDINSLRYREHNKSLRVWMNPSSINTNFEFVLKFNIKLKNI